MGAGTLLGAVWLALLIDHWLGEPDVRWHPVVWMGHYLGWVGKRIAPLMAVAGDASVSATVAPSRYRPFMAGALAWSFGATAVLMVALALQHLALGLPVWAAIFMLGLLLKPMLAWRMLRTEVLAVEAALAISLEAGRARLARLVSRNVSQLSEVEVRESAIESLAENLNDSVVAPVFWFLLFGLPGAALYRFANTADAMWGYLGERNGRDWTWAGKWAARADDVLSWVPARLTAALLVLTFSLHCRGSKLGGATLRVVLKSLRHDAVRTPSPNSGWPMAAMALLLGVRLGKPGTYTLNATGREPVTGDVLQATHLAKTSVVALAVLSALAIGFAQRINYLLLIMYNS